MGVWSIITSKNFLILTLFILATSISIWLLTTPTPTFHTIMFETHKQITTNLKNINVMSSSRDQQASDLDETYMELLGFTDNPRLYPDGPEDPEIKVGSHRIQEDPEIKVGSHRIQEDTEIKVGSHRIQEDPEIKVSSHRIQEDP